LPVHLEPNELSHILTSIGLEVESMEKYESVRGSLHGLQIGKVLRVTQHPNADKLKMTLVDTGEADPLQIVCGAPNVAEGQTVIVAPVNTTIFPEGKPPMTMSVATIRGVKSYGMICAADEIGTGSDHSGIIVIPSEIAPGVPAASYFKPYHDTIFELGITPNRMDAMSHLGVARDVCAYLSYHRKQSLQVISPFKNDVSPDNTSNPFQVIIENPSACHRYSGVAISDVTIGPSPAWLLENLRAIGVRPINNIVDITNFILHETGQPLHAFDADQVKGKKLVIKNLPEGTAFLSLDEKERKLSAQDLMICDESSPMCIAGVFGGLTSGISDKTTNIFLESAWFNPIDIRKTSFRHQLRTDAATRFEKGVDISNTINVLKRAAAMIKEVAGGKISSQFVDIYPTPRQEQVISLRYDYLKKLVGKEYPPSAARSILEALGFNIIHEGSEEISVSPPFSKTDVSIPADLVEEILRIDGFDNVAIPTAITITPSVSNGSKASYKEKLSGYLAGLGFHELLTNSITNGNYYAPGTGTVKMLNSLSANLDVMRPSMLESGLETIAFNLNRRNNDLLLFEFGRTYHTQGPGKYSETDHLALYVTGNESSDSWRKKAGKADFYYLKGVMKSLLEILGLKNAEISELPPDGMIASGNGKTLCHLAIVDAQTLERFHIKQPVYFADFNWDNVMAEALSKKVSFVELPKQLPVRRDLAMVVPKDLSYQSVEKLVHSMKLPKLQDMQLFDVFENEKLGIDKKSLAISFSFLDKDKTLTEKDIDGMLTVIMSLLENRLHAEIRK
ncbi:MAG: phenylalanine--tRNA ligase subunit beta, partial [Chitinophagaceae bacterium]